MVRQFVKLASMCVIFALSSCSDRDEVAVDVDAEMSQRIAEAMSDIQVVSNKEFRVQLITFDADESTPSERGVRRRAPARRGTRIDLGQCTR